MYSEPINCTDDSASGEQIDQALEKLTTKLNADLEKLQELMDTPTGQGQVDALLDQPSASNSSEYQASYDKMRSAALLAPAQVHQMVAAMRPFVEALLKEFRS